MTNTRIVSRYSRSMRLAAAMSAAVMLVACSSDKGSDKSSSDSKPSDSASSSQSQPAGQSSSDNSDKPSKPMPELLIAANEAQGVQLQPTPAEQLQQGLQMALGIGEGIKTEPAECSPTPNTDASAFKDAAAAQGIDGTTAMSVLIDPGSASQNAVGNLTKPGCEHMTVTADMAGQQLKVEIDSEKVDVKAPEGVSNFVAIKQSSTGEVAGQQVISQTLSLVGTVRGVTVQVNAATASGDLAPEQEQKAQDLFNAQAEKIRNA